MPNGAALPDRQLGSAYRLNSNEYNHELSGDLIQEDRTLCCTSESQKTTNLVRYYSCDTFFLVKEPARSFNGDQHTINKTASLQFMDGICRPLSLGGTVQVGKSNCDYIWRGESNQSGEQLPMLTKNAESTDGSCTSYNISPGLLRLFASSVFRIDLALKYLFDKDDINIQAYLAQRLFDFPTQEVDFYLLQLVSLYHNSQVLAKLLFPYFIYRCARSIEFSVHLIWLLDTFSPRLRRDCSLRRTFSSLLQCRTLNDQLISQLRVPDAGVCGSLTHSASDAAFRVARLPRAEQEGLVADSSQMPKSLATAATMVTEGSQFDALSNPVECLRNTLLPLGDQQLLGILHMAAQRNALWQATWCSSHAGIHHLHHESDLASASWVETGSDAGVLKRSTIPGGLTCRQLGSKAMCRHKRAVSDLTNLTSYPRHRARIPPTDLASGCLSANGGQGRGDNLASTSANQAGVVMTQPRSLSSSLLASRDSAVGLSRDNDLGRATTSVAVGAPSERNRSEDGHSDSDHSTGGDDHLRINSLPQRQPNLETAVISTDSENGPLTLSFTSPLSLDDTFVKETGAVEPNGPPASIPTETSTSSPSDSGLNMVITSNNGGDDLATPVGEASQVMPQWPSQAADDVTINGDWLSADRRLGMQVHLVPRILPQWEFVDALMRLARRLVPIASKEQRTAYLQAELANINSNLPARVWLPVNKADHVVLRIPPTAAVCLNSKDKAPFMVYFEVLDCQDPWSTSLPHCSTHGSLRLCRDTPDQFAGSGYSKTTTTVTTSLTSISSAGANDCQSPTSLHSSGPGSIVELDAVSLTSSVLLDSTESATAANEPQHQHSFVISSSTLPRDSNHCAPRLQLHDGTVILSCRDDGLGSSTGQGQGDLGQEDVEKQQATDSANTTTAPIIYVSAGDIRNRLKQLSEHQLHKSFKTDPEDPSAAVLKEPWTMKCERIRSHSPWGHLPGWRLTAAIVKVGDDLRQEQLAYQLLNLLQRIWAAEYIPLWLRPLTVVVTSADSGLIEPVPDTVSLHQIHRHARLSLLDYLFREHGSANSEAFLQAQKNFVHSCAAYCLIGYLLQVKDRHNGNILLDSEGHVIHIDYGFILSASPGKNLGFEKSPFKLTPEQVAVMGGTNSDLFEYFKCLLLKGLLAARKHMDDICLLVEIASATCPGLPCFASGGQDTVSRLRQRFMRTRVESSVQQRVNAMVEESLHSVTTKLYDSFQYYTNGIQY